MHFNVFLLTQHFSMFSVSPNIYFCIVNKVVVKYMENTVVTAFTLSQQKTQLMSTPCFCLWALFYSTGRFLIFFPKALWHPLLMKSSRSTGLTANIL